MDASWFPAVNRFARSTPWLHTLLAAYARYGLLAWAGRTPLRPLVRRQDSPAPVVAAPWS
ncbi:hypothetical protein COUCH_15570 [Couchioplanes caeruleus]|uniref:hypothetical protein n=1 Tax=Couchioplanes caeruleus TaxID=56438 RepID=UPI0020BED5C4|nr:hypothetical protein [Couchioplanes caeruleus]UQU67598.1 hypothetical protein COUCH_15570 [Couchioplanes caeruleus]